MEIFVQQLINGITLGSIYGLIAIGYTMVFGIIGMVNFAHGDVFMVSAFIALIALLILTTWLGIASVVLALLIVLVVAMVLTSLVNWAIERVAYRPLRGSFRLAPLISAIGMSILLSNFVQVAQGPRNKSIPPLVRERDRADGRRRLRRSPSPTSRSSSGSVTAVLLLAFWYVVAKTSLGRAQRACEQDQKMAALLGIDVDRTISITFVIGAALAAVAGTMYLMYYGVVNFADGFVPGVKAFTAAVLGGIGSLPGAVIGGMLIGLIETMWSAYFSIDYKDVAAFSVLADHADLPAAGPARPAGRRESVTCRRHELPPADAHIDLAAVAEGCGPDGGPRLLPAAAADRLQDRPEHPQRDRARDSRWPLLLSFVAIAAIGRLLYSLTIVPWRAHRALRKLPDEAAPTRLRTALGRWLPPFLLGFVLIYPALVLSTGRLRRRGKVDRQFRHPDPDLCDARLGPQHRGRARRPARPRLRRVLRGRRLLVRAARQGVRLLVLACCCRSPAASRRSGASCSAFRCCACAATISRSSRWRSARSSAWC